jgi:enoyl-CoA hydratase/carnithine racemase
MAMIEIKRHGRVVLATFDNPPHQLLDSSLVAAIGRLVADVDADASVGAVVLASAHPSRWIAHYDVGELIVAARKVGRRLSPRMARTAVRATEAARRLPLGAAALRRTPLAGLVELREFHDLMTRIQRSHSIFIAAMGGSALGGGLELAQVCDLRYMADGDFVLGQPEILLGLLPGGGGTQRLVRLIGASRAIELLLDGGLLSPREALRCGLIHRIFPPERLLSRSLESADRLARRPGAAVALTKRVVYEGGSGLHRGLVDERAAFAALLTTPDAGRIVDEFVDQTRATGNLPTYDAALWTRLWEGKFG